MPARFFLWFSISIATLVPGRNDNLPVGARSNALANSNSTLVDEWSIFNNVAGLGRLDSSYLASAYVGDIYLVPQFRLMSFAFSAPFKSGGLGFGVYRFGDALYNEQKATLGYGHRIRNISLGVQTTYVQLAAENHRSRGNVLIEFGGIVDLTSKIRFGAHVYNASQTRISEYLDERLSTLMKLGFAYKFGNKTTAFAEVEKNVQVKETFKAGLEYQVIPNLFLRTGISTYAFNNSVGIGYQKNHFKFDYAFNWNEKFGAINHFTLSWNFKRPKTTSSLKETEILD